MPKLETREKAKKAWDLRPNLSIEEVAKRLGVSRARVTEYLKQNSVPKVVHQMAVTFKMFKFIQDVQEIVAL